MTEPALSSLNVRGPRRLMAVEARLVTGIGLVNTIPEPCRGYGSALAYAIASRLVTTDTQAMLFADANDPSSNSIHERLGFAAVAQLVEVESREVVYGAVVPERGVVT